MARRGRQRDEIKDLVESWIYSATASPGTALGTYPILSSLSTTMLLSTHGSTAYNGTTGVVFTCPRSAYYRFVLKLYWDWRRVLANGFYLPRLILNGDVNNYLNLYGRGPYMVEANMFAPAFVDQVPIYFPMSVETIAFVKAGTTVYPALTNNLGGYTTAPTLGGFWFEIHSITDSRRTGSF